MKTLKIDHISPFTKRLQMLLTCLTTSLLVASERPNVILIMTDDQGYGDLSCHGHPYLKTPEIDLLHQESIRFTDFHVSSFCTPTRAAIMTGNYPAKTGAFRTTGGRSAMLRKQKTVAELFAENGYITGMLGKWHLGDNAPHRPQDRGFQYALWHRCGGIGQASDYYGNNYYNDTYERVTPAIPHGEWEKASGYCTDVWFREAHDFIKTHQETPFFLYLALNAPHGPYIVPNKWAAPYRNNEDIPNANFLGMIANIDHNVGLLRDELERLNLSDNTILIFMTDNGTSAGVKLDQHPLDGVRKTGYNAGMRGKKSSIYEGGGRVPCFIYWPDGNLMGGREIETLTAHIDLVPTLADLCELRVDDRYNFDGISWKPLLYGGDWSREAHVEHFHGGAYGRVSLSKPQEFSSVMTEKWRFITNYGKRELYDIELDPAQKNNVIHDNEEIVTQLQSVYNRYWEQVFPGVMEAPRIDLGNMGENPTTLCSQDWFSPRKYPPYAISQITKLPKVNYPWLVNVVSSGKYRFTLRQLPELAEKVILGVKAGKVSINGVEKLIEVAPNSESIEIDLEIPFDGGHELWTTLVYEDGTESGAYFTTVEKL